MKNFLRIPSSLKTDRDLLLYFIWSTGLAGNKELGALFGLTYSAVSKQVGLMRVKVYHDGSRAGSLTPKTRVRSPLGPFLRFTAPPKA